MFDVGDVPPPRQAYVNVGQSSRANRRRKQRWQESRQTTTQVQLKCNSSATQVHLKCNSSPTQMQLKSNSSLTQRGKPKLYTARNVFVVVHPVRLLFGHTVPRIGISQLTQLDPVIESVDRPRRVQLVPSNVGWLGYRRFRAVRNAQLVGLSAVSSGT
jgi:hypothetical protein